MKPEIVTLVTHHPGRPLDCLRHALDSLCQATLLPHLIDLHVQGRRSSRLEAVKKEFPVEVTYHGSNTGQAPPIVTSTKKALDLGCPWWAKLDDDGALPPLAWDHLIEALEAVGQLAACAMACPNGQSPPRLFRRIAGQRVHLREGFLASGKTRNSHWLACHCVGDGCTVFRTLTFRMGAAWDRRYKVSTDLDLAFQVHRMGMIELMCTKPIAEHQHADCSPLSYDKVRYDFDDITRTADLFKSKWGVDCTHLRNAKRRY